MEGTDEALPSRRRPAGGPDPALLARLEPGTEIAAGKVRGLAAAAPRLVEAGWIATRRQGRAVMVSLTDAGVERRARMRPVSVEALIERLAAAEARIAALEAAIGNGSGSGHSPVDENLVLSVIADLDHRLQLGGIVPIPDVRAELRRRGIAAADAAVNDALESLERSWRIDLGAAQAPTGVADREAGIERPGRGLLYYIARR